MKKTGAKRMRLCRLWLILCLTVLMTAALTFAVHADTGPKPSVRITFRNMSDTLCYATLLSREPSTGPHSVWDGNENSMEFYGTGEEKEIWLAFAEYKDTDGYFFLQAMWKLGDVKEFTWGYYPPENFKILLYYPEAKRFVSGGVCETYAFDSYYDVDMSGFDIENVTYDEENSTDERLTAFRSYRYAEEAKGLIFRFLLTVAVEILIALSFGYRKKRQLGLLIAVNAATQLLLNLCLCLLHYRSGYGFGYQATYFLAEVAVFAIEAVLYSRLLVRRGEESPRPKWLPTLYAFVANTASYLTGLLLYRYLPGLF